MCHSLQKICKKKKSTLYSEWSVAETNNYCGPSKEVVIHVINIMSQRSASLEKSSVWKLSYFNIKPLTKLHDLFKDHFEFILRVILIVDNLSVRQ